MEEQRKIYFNSQILWFFRCEFIIFWSFSSLVLYIKKRNELALVCNLSTKSEFVQIIIIPHDIMTKTEQHKYSPQFPLLYWFYTEAKK